MDQEESGLSEERVKERLQYMLDEKEKQLAQAGSLGQRILSQQMELEDRINRINLSQGSEPNEDAELLGKLEELEELLAWWEAENAATFSTLTASSARVDQSPMNGATQFPPPLRAVPFSQETRRVKNAAHRADDVEFAFEIGSGLLNEVRRLQSLLGERDKEIQDLKGEKDDLRKSNTLFRGNIVLHEQTASRIKGENQSLKMSLAELRSQVGASKSGNDPFKSNGRDLRSEEVGKLENGSTPSDMTDPSVQIELLWHRLQRSLPKEKASPSKLTRKASGSSTTSSINSEPGLRDWTGFIGKGRRIGGGAFGDVYLGKWGNLPPEASTLANKAYLARSGAKDPPSVVVKVIRSFMRDAVALDRAKSMRRELEVWLRLTHSNIVPFVGVVYGVDEFETEGDGPLGGAEDTRCPAMISLWMENGNLRQYLRKNQDRKLLRVPLLLQVARGLSYLHDFEVRIVHGDLKAENIFVSSDGTLRIGDFGLSRMLCDETLWLTNASQAGGTARWMAPELLDGRQKTISTQSDVWAYGMVGYEIFTKQVPFPHYAIDGQVITAIVLRLERPERPPRMTDWSWGILVDCWAEAEKRVEIKDIVQRLEAVVL